LTRAGLFSGCVAYVFTMLHLTWFFRMIRDVAVYGWTNRSFGLAAMILVLIGIGLIIGAAAVSAPWIYTLF
jgi:hypothetical protein